MPDVVTEWSWLRGMKTSEEDYLVWLDNQGLLVVGTLAMRPYQVRTGVI